ncbi:hypothetical protein EON64_02840 [archaeon]|nr:MAG: hypothetical protein EON64_02840 [archaeon]
MPKAWERMAFTYCVRDNTSCQAKPNANFRLLECTIRELEADADRERQVCEGVGYGQVTLRS